MWKVFGFTVSLTQSFLMNSHYLFVICLDYIKKKCLKRVRDDIKTIFKNTKNNKIYEFTENRIK